MIKKQFEKEQSIAYQILKKAVEKNQLSHAYIFSGASGTSKKEVAYLLAQTLICKQGSPFACEVCDDCKRIVENQYADIIYLDGSKQSIKKEQILNLQQQFNKTGLEVFNQKVYILNQAENATPEALNSLLKFLEEPAGSGVTAILLVEQVDRVLPTIVSRCQTISFKSLGQNDCFQQGIDKGMNSLDAYLLSHLMRNSDKMLEVSEQESYQLAIQLFQSFIQNLIYNVDMTLTRLQIEGFGSKNKENQKETLQYLLDFSIVFFKDIDKEAQTVNEWWINQLGIYRNKRINNQDILRSLLEGKDRLNRYVNIQLLVDQIISEIKEVL